MTDESRRAKDDAAEDARTAHLFERIEQLERVANEAATFCNMYRVCFEAKGGLVDRTPETIARYDLLGGLRSALRAAGYLEVCPPMT